MAPFVAEMEFYGKQLRVEAYSQDSLLAKINDEQSKYFRSAFIHLVFGAIAVWMFIIFYNPHVISNIVFAIIAFKMALDSIRNLVPDAFVWLKWVGEEKRKRKEFEPVAAPEAEAR